MRIRDKIKPRKHSELIVIGGGAAGLAAAIAAGRAGIRCVILERLDRVGRKILATGNGRCNLTNLNADQRDYHGTDPAFAKSVLDQFGVKDTLSFFNGLGLLWKTEEDGRVFPVTDQASAVLDLLRYELKRVQAEENCGSEAVSIEKTGTEFRISLINSHVYFADRIILAAGGRAVPSLGSNGSGFYLAQMLGHTLVEPMPAIVQIRLKGAFLKRLKGVKFHGSLSLHCGDDVFGRESGEILFTDYGLSGPPALRLSRKVNEQLQMGKKITIRLDLFPEKLPPEFLVMLDERIKMLYYKDVADSLVGMIHKRLIPVLLENAMIDRDKSCRNLSRQEIERLAVSLKSWNVDVYGTRSWLDAQVSTGGVSADEINPATLESKRIPGLFFAGEIIDIDGDSGGYNLQWAWSSGHVAGTHAAKNAVDINTI